MIQRIQTVYLLLAITAIIIALYLPLGYMIEPNGSEHVFNNLGVMLIGEYQSTWGLFVILIIAIIAAAGAIVLFKNRMLQLRFGIFSSLMCIGYYLAFLAFYLVLRNDAIVFRLHWALCLPLVALILNYLAVRAIGKDEAMVQAADRLR